MRIIRWLLLALLLLTGLWFAAEPLLVSQARKGVPADSIAAQPGPGRLGLTLKGVMLPTQTGLFTLPSLDAWVTPLAPLTLRAILPDSAVLEDAAGRRQISMNGAKARIKLSPLGGTLKQMQAQFDALGLDGVDLSGPGRVTIRAVGDDRVPGAAYQAQLDLADLRLPQIAAATGGLRIWMDRPLGLNAGPEAPMVQGIMTEGLDIDARGLALRIAGLLQKGPDGRAEGRLAIYASDPGALLDNAVDHGLLPPQARLLVGAMLNRIGQADFTGPLLPGQPPMPPAPQGQLRIPVEMRDGQMLLGGIQVGQAPAWPTP
ncbi:DUF2125 domain-containing protein [Paracoccus aerius]|uniref:DUF2125 domain-containing protein n=1 Tax=Paracoccus aerius TaxID=1915382 RepID=A0ABS1S6L2_9RHOB|nr:DUF2125 domain-containing protein [Paracoccus aerius]MBL3674367.1 DUF2125 domain-containing protein [Paracoccus aerius]GHG25111.1 hypothetical protein GCM10017322_24090 [Paracoccus aerius]